MSENQVDRQVEPAQARRLWHLLEPLHAVLYYAPEVFEEAGALGYSAEDRWASYFPFRAAPLGPVGSQAVASAFYGFRPAMVARYFDDAWKATGPEVALAARLRGIDRAYRTLFGDLIDRPELAEAAALARSAAEAADTAGRPLAAANAALEWPAEPHLQLWQAATILREHRGDGHLAALLLAGLDPVESLVSFAAIGAASVERFESRGWTPEEWAAARDRLAARGLIEADGTATEAGRDLRRRIEQDTDRLALGPWRALGSEGAERLAALLGDYWVAVIGSGLLPSESTLGIGKV
ncbi:hypothetical protein OG562_17190 [Streptomyces sp. NBC_01275]|uniref:SCO6745 family protein n=1 Tax=Streptomyces sp. NBC_01275 TaxID=2903807 RepID=UPI00224EE485|nr:hypothetical protein [Streptomyces sp. NBC_01275]MCX4762681.1 hypothetical protein [Streptomyces sp. NBC_01275]